jgi:hypothetical protein
MAVESSLTIGALNERAQFLQQVSENGARLARVAVVYESSGNGELKVAEPIEFGLHFTEEPSVTTGRVLVDGQALVSGQYPNGDSGVWRWKRDEKGYYVGAYIYFVVDSNLRNYKMHHHLIFEAEALKMFNQRMMSEADEDQKVPLETPPTGSTIVDPDMLDVDEP